MLSYFAADKAENCKTENENKNKLYYKGKQTINIRRQSETNHR